MVGSLTTPDISRYCKTKSNLFWMITLCIIVGEFIINGISIYIAYKLNTDDIVSVITKNAGMIGFMSIILSVIKVNDVGVIFPPIAGVMLVDYYILKTSRKILDETREKGLLPDDSQTPLIVWAAIIACIVGTLVGVFFNFGIPSLNSIFAAGVAYWLLMKKR